MYHIFIQQYNYTVAVYTFDAQSLTTGGTSVTINTNEYWRNDALWTFLCALRFTATTEPTRKKNNDGRRQARRYQDAQETHGREPCQDVRGWCSNIRDGTHLKFYCTMHHNDTNRSRMRQDSVSDAKYYYTGTIKQNHADNSVHVCVCVRGYVHV